MRDVIFSLRVFKCRKAPTFSKINRCPPPPIPASSSPRRGIMIRTMSAHQSLVYDRSPSYLPTHLGKRGSESGSVAVDFWCRKLGWKLAL